MSYFPIVWDESLPYIRQIDYSIKQDIIMRESALTLDWIVDRLFGIWYPKGMLLLDQDNQLSINT